MFHINSTAANITCTGLHDTLHIEAWGPHAVRIRAAPFRVIPENRVSVLLPPPPCSATVVMDEGDAILTNGHLQVRVSSQGRLQMRSIETGKILLEEGGNNPGNRRGRSFRSAGGDLSHVEQLFRPQKGEAFYGMGQHRHGLLNQRGCVLELSQFNGEVNIPVVHSNRGYVFLWNNPGVGRAEFAETGTRWVADASSTLDYWVAAADGWAERSRLYAVATGLPPVLPEWASGFIQSKLRYRTQAELMEVAREYRRRGLPLSCIVVDFFHWTHMGDWKFNPVDWPDPVRMVAELRGMGIELLVSVWPTVTCFSENYQSMKDGRLLVETERGLPFVNEFMDLEPYGPAPLAYYDATSQEARNFLMDKIAANYVSMGIRSFWLDACEPEMYPAHFDNVRFAAGRGDAVANIYPFCNQMAFSEGLATLGVENPFLLSRSAFAGSQRFGTAVWSGDIESSFEDLRQQVRAGLNMALSGIPWWTTDIGGFMNGNPGDPEFRELLVRWFEYGTFCPLFRLHGVREPVGSHLEGGGDNEVWSFGEEVYDLIAPCLFLRERLRPYIMRQMEQAAQDGTPPMRPVFYDFAEDPEAWQIDDQFMLGPDLMVVPVLEYQARRRDVRLPAGRTWINAWTGAEHLGGTVFEVEAAPGRIPVYVLDKALLACFRDLPRGR